jgi:predicted NBD/HSP70 family sugar kinase
MRKTSTSTGANSLSARVVIEAILHQGPISRARLAQVTGLSKQTTSEAVRLLEAAGWVGVRGRTQGKLGRSAIDYELQANAAFVLGVDLGGAKIRAALADLSGAAVVETTVATDRRGGAHVIDQIGALREQVVARANIDPAKLRLAVVGTPGVVEPATGMVRQAPNIPGLDSRDVVAGLREALACETVVENDINLAALGEQWQGHGQAPRNLAFIALGTGLGMGLVIDGRLMRGARGAAGEIGYLPLGTDPFAAESRHFGALERAIGADGVVARYEAEGGQKGLTVPAIFERLAAGDEAATAAIDAVARWLALATASVCAILDLEQVVFGGSIGGRPELIARVEALLPLCMARPAPLARSALRERATIVGALATGLSRLQNQLFGVADLPGELDLPPPPDALNARAA